jgi:hypothetical protein
MSELSDAYNELEAAIQKVVDVEFDSPGPVVRWVVCAAHVEPDMRSTGYVRLFPHGGEMPMDMALGLLEYTRLRLVEEC